MSMTSEQINEMYSRLGLQAVRLSDTERCLRDAKMLVEELWDRDAQIKRLREAHANFMAAYINSGPDEAKRLVSVLLAPPGLPTLRDALAQLVRVIEVGGIHNLSRGVELGATSWSVKASDALGAAHRALAEVPE